MSISIRDAHSPDDRLWIESAFQEYLDELSRATMNTGLFPVYGDFGDRRPDLMARWFADDSSHPLVILKDDRPVGFALVSRPPVHQRAQLDFRMAEFYVLSRARRLGVGRDAAQLIFKRFAGRWEVSEVVSNRGAVAFWRAVVNEFTRGRYRESVNSGEVHQRFDSRPPAPKSSPHTESR